MSFLRSILLLPLLPFLLTIILRLGITWHLVYCSFFLIVTSFKNIYYIYLCVCICALLHIFKGQRITWRSQFSFSIWVLVIKFRLSGLFFKKKNKIKQGLGLHIVLAVQELRPWPQRTGIRDSERSACLCWGYRHVPSVLVSVRLSISADTC